MSSEVVITVKGTDHASGVFDAIGNKARGLGGVFGDVGKTAAGFLAAGAITNGLSAFAGQLGDVYSSAREAVMVGKQTEAVIKSTGGAAGLSAEEVGKYAQKLMQVTNFEDDVTQAGQNMLLTFTNIGKDVFPQATETMLDMSQALGQDVTASAMQLGKALNDPIQGVTALRRVGVQLTDQQEAQIKKMVEVGDVAGAQKVILGELAREFGGSARAAADPMTQLSNSIGDVKEGIGLALLPAINQFARAMVSGVIPALNKGVEMFSALMSKAAPALANLTAGVTSFARNGMAKMQEFFGVFEDSPFSGLTIELGKALGLSGDQLGGWQQNIKAIFGEIREDLARALAPAAEAFKGLGREAGEAFKDVLTAVREILPVLAELASNVMPILLQGFNIWAQYISTTATVILDLVSALATGIAEIVKWADEVGILGAAILGLSTVVDIVGAAIEFIAPIVERVTSFFAENRTASIALAAALGVVLVALFPIPAAIIGIITVIGLLRQHWDSIRDKTIEVWTSIDQALGGLLSNIVDVFKAQFDVIRTDVENAMAIIKDIIEIVMALIRGDWSEAWDQIRELVFHVWDLIREGIATRIALIQAQLNLAWDLIRYVATIAWDALRATVVSLLDQVVAAVTDMPRRMLDQLFAWAAAGLQLGNSAGTAIIEAMKSGLRGVSGLDDALIDALRSAWNAMIDWADANFSISIGKDPFKVEWDPDLSIFKLATGGRNIAGGFALVGEQGPELVRLPRGADVFNSDETRRMFEQSGGKGDVRVEFNGPVTINARDKADAERSTGDVGWGIAQGLRARGVWA